MAEQRTEQVHNLRRALLNWYPFTRGENALLCGDDTEILVPLLTPWFDRVEQAEVSELARPLPDETRRFDLIVAVDLVETQADVPAILRSLAGRLSADGTLLLGFRNRFGLKYLCGGVDALTQTPFDAVLPMTGKSLPRFYAREEMRQLLEAAGFAAPRWYYPMPDADFVQAVYTDDLLPSGSIRDRVFPYDPYRSPIVAAEADLYDDVAREGVLPHTANYYLAECRLPGAASPRRQVVYAALSTDRGPERGFTTILYADGTAEKTVLDPKGLPALRDLYSNLEALCARGIPTVEQTLLEDRIRMPLVREEASLHYLARQLRGNPEAFLDVFSQIREDVLLSSEEGALSDAEALEIWGAPAARLGPILKRAYIDMIPYNAFWTGERLRYYDQEFAVENCPVRYVLFRALRYTWLHLPQAEGVLPLKQMKKRFGLEDLWDGFQAREDLFVRENRRQKELGQLYAWAQIDRKAIRKRRELLAQEDPAAREAVLLQRVHAVQLGLLKEFDRVCRANGLRYFAVHGTLLGAVRHGGFIPWDDDIDLAMPREDYDRFSALAEKELKEGFFFQTPESDPSCFYGGYGKLRDSRSAALEPQNRGRSCHQGIWIDVFPLDCVPERAEQRAHLQKKLRFIQRLLFAKSYPIRTGMLADVGDCKISAYYVLRKCFRRRDLLKALHRLCAARPQTGLRSILACYYGNGAVNKNLFPEADCSDLVELPFEGMRISVPANYDSWLRQRYGANYMTPPSMEKRYRHDRVEFHPDTPYSAL